MQPLDADLFVVRYLGPNLQTATQRLFGGALVGCAVVALIIRVIG
jgi:acyl-CoA thioesterase